MSDIHPAAVDVNLHVLSTQVKVQDLTEPGHDLVVLRLGESAARVNLLGTLADVTAVVQAAAHQLAEVGAERAGKMMRTPYESLIVADTAAREEQ